MPKEKLGWPDIFAREILIWTGIATVPIVFAIGNAIRWFTKVRNEPIASDFVWEVSVNSAINGFFRGGMIGILVALSLGILRLLVSMKNQEAAGVDTDRSN